MDNLIINNKKAIQFIKEKKFDFALNLLKKNTLLYPCAESFNNLAFALIYIDESNIFEAEKNVIESIKYKPKSSIPYSLYGYILMFKGKYKHAIQIYHKSIKYGINNTSKHNLALAYHIIKDYTMATAYFTQASIDENSTNVNKQHSIYCLFINLYKKDVFPVLKTRISQPEFLLHDEDLFLAQIWYGLDNFEKAVYYFEKAIEIYYLESEWLLQYMFSLIKIGEYRKASEIQSYFISIKNKYILDLYEENDNGNKDEIYFTYVEIETIKNISLENFIQKPLLNFEISYNTSFLPSWHMFFND